MLENKNIILLKTKNREANYIIKQGIILLKTLCNNNSQSFVFN
ncbi:hypothetical protein SAMN05421856_101411 [Chryseobacterium taichungense]|uniref:Uncharacterized protein n=1 Tax=Chryseobacterium taichungense TaxID=295069 RepID=A0A1H7W0U8_9FLAO|nr:hypothetical protein SAMN05421856_101411 [Chryseobacterium taichungense]